MGRKPDPEVQKKREKALELELKGVSPEEIAARMGIDRVGKVRRWLIEIRGTKRKVQPGRRAAMGRKPDPEVQKKRERALELELKGGSPEEIAARMGIDRVGKVRRWLIEIRGASESARAKYARLLNQGKSRAEAMAETGISLRHAQRVESEIEGRKREYVFKKDRVPEFLNNPDVYRAEAWARSETFCRELNAHCRALVFRNPVGAGWAVELAVEHFEVLLQLRTGPKASRWTRCKLVQAHAIEAARLRSMKELDKAAERLDLAQTTTFGCVACDADLERRAARLLIDLGRGEDALRRVERSKALYLDLGNNGHDLTGNAQANCASIEALILTRLREFDRSIQVADGALPAVSPVESEDLYLTLWFNMCVAIFRRGGEGDASRALALCETHAEQYFGEDPPCQNRARMFWFKAKIHESEGRLGAAIEALEEALCIVEEIELRPGVAAIVADLERLDPDPSGGSLQGRLEEFEDYGKDGIAFLPRWLEPFSDLFERVKEIAEQNIGEAIRTLRAEGGGAEFMPEMPIA